MVMTIAQRSVCGFLPPDQLLTRLRSVLTTCVLIKMECSSMLNRVSYSVAQNCMTLIKEGACNDAFEALGIIPEDFDLVCSGIPYIGDDRLRVTNVLNSLIWGTLDVVGLPRIEVPTEFIASVLCVFVAPGNLAVSCRWMESGSSAEDLVSGGSLEPVTARQLFALCCQLQKDAPVATARWEQRTGRAVKRVLEEVPSTSEKSNG